MDCTLPLSAEEAKTYTNILEAVSALPKSDPRYSFVIGVTWWLFNRRRRLEQQSIRRRQFYRRWRRLLLLRWQTQRNLLTGISSAMKTSEMVSTEDLDILPEKRLWVKKDRSQDFWSQLEEGEFSSETFLKHFHMSNATFEFLYNELSEHLTKSNTTMRDPLPGKKRLAATIYRLATNAEYLKVANLFGIGKSTTTSLIRDVCEIIVRTLRHKFLKFFPDSHWTLEENIENSSEKFKVPQCVGALGSIDVFIVGSSWNMSENTAYNSSYAKSLALIFQAVVDYNGCFCHVTAGHPASITNSAVVEMSKLDETMSKTFCGLEKIINDVQVPPIILADSSHYVPSAEHIVTPLLDSDDENNFKYNQLLTEAHHHFTEAVLKVKSRWKIFHGKNGKINFNADAFQNIALACCILHNICELRGDPLDNEWSDDVGDSLFVRKSETENEMEFSSFDGIDDVKQENEASASVKNAIASFINENP